MLHIALRSATKRFADRVILDRVDLDLNAGERIGIVGENGSGKSTLLWLLAGELEPDAGEVSRSVPGGVGHLRQALELPASATVDDAIDTSQAALRALERDIRAVERSLAELDGDDLDAALGRYAHLLDRYDAVDGHGAAARLDAALERLGVGAIERDRPWATLSGGERRRTALAATVAARPELLLLDEPTNDLDDDAFDWLVVALRRHRGTVVAVTHDRAFLDAFTEVIWEVDGGAVARHGDGYAGFLRAKAAERERQRLAHEAWRDELARHSALVAANADRLAAIPRKLDKAGMGVGAFRPRGRDHGAMGRIRNAKERIARLTEHPVAPPPEPLVFVPSLERATDGAGTADRDDGPILEFDGLQVAEITVGDLRLAAGDRLLVTGPNGIGKTTLLLTIESERMPRAGAVRVTGRVGHLRQHSTIAPERATVLEAYAAGLPADLETAEVRIARFGLFRPAELHVPVADLSYGQRRRLELALLVSRPPDLLLLDEPTNHLSPALVEDLERALDSFDGAVVLVTHDRRMRERFRGARLELGSVVAVP